MVSFDPVSRTIIAGFSSTSTLINISPNALLYSNGTSRGSRGCGNAPRPRATARASTTEHRLAAFTSADSLLLQVAAARSSLQCWRTVDTRSDKPQGGSKSRCPPAVTLNSSRHPSRWLGIYACYVGSLLAGFSSAVNAPRFLHSLSR